MERTSALEPSGAKLVGFLALALVNQALAFTIADRSELGTRLLHRAIDAGQLLALGVVSFFTAMLAARVLRRLGRSPGSLPPSCSHSASSSSPCSRYPKI